MANLGFILKEKVMDATSNMTDKEFRETITGLFQYAVTGKEPEFNSELQKTIFLFEKDAIDYNNSKWAERREPAKQLRNTKNYIGRVSDFDKNQAPF